MTVCFAGGCKHRSSATCKLFRFPAKRKHRKRWIKACRRADRECTANDRLCSCHFQDGKKENGPTIFSYEKTAGLFPEGPIKKKRKKDKRPNVTAPMDLEDIVALCGMGALPVDSEHTTTAPTYSVQVYNPDPCQNEQCFTKRKFLADKVSMLEREMSGLRNKIAHLEAQCLRLSIDRITHGSLPSTERVNQLEQVIRDLEKKIAKLESQPPRMSIDHIKDDKDKILLYTSFTLDVFSILVDILKKKGPLTYHAKWPVTRMSLENQLLLTLMKLRLNCRDLDLSDRFQVSRATVTNIIHTLVSALLEILYDAKVVGIHSQSKWKGSMPKSFEEFVSAQVAMDTMAMSQDTPRIQVERTNARIKNFEILHHIPGMYKSISAQICQLCVCLANLQSPLLKKIVNMYEMQSNENEARMSDI